MLLEISTKIQDFKGFKGEHLPLAHSISREINLKYFRWGGR